MAKTRRKSKPEFKLKHFLKDFDREVLGSFKFLHNLFLIKDNERYRDFLKIRAANRPFNSDHYFDFTTSNIRMQQYDPEAMNVLDQAVSGMMTYHYNPIDTFMELTDVSFLGKRQNRNNASVAKAIAERNHDIHLLLQSPHSLVTEANIHYDKILFGVACKRIRFDGEKFITTHYPVEDAAIGSSDRQFHNIFGYREKMDAFAAQSVYTEAIDDDINATWMSATLTHKTNDNYYTFNIPYKVIKAHIIHSMATSYIDKKDVMTLIDYRFKKTAMSKKEKREDKLWAEIVFTDKGLVSLKVIPRREIIVTQALPSPTRMCISKGFGIRALPIVIAMTHKFEMDLSGYEKQAGPPVVTPDEASTYGLNLGRDGLIYASEGSADTPRYLQFPFSMPNVAGMGEHYSRKLSATLLADMFDLIQKVNMPTPEVDERRANSLRKGVLYTAKDEEDNLVPVCDYLNFHITHLFGGGGLDDTLLKGRYISPLSRAHMMSRFETLDRAMLSIVNIGKATQANPQAKAVLKTYDSIKKILVSNNLEDLIYEENEIEANIQQEQDRVLTADETAREGQIKAMLENAEKERSLAGGQPPAEGGSPAGEGDTGEPPPEVQRFPQ